MWDNNRYFGTSNMRYGSVVTTYSSFKAQTVFDQSSTYSSATLTGVWSFVRPNRCEAGRGSIVVYNWDHVNSVSVDLSSALTPGMQYEVRDAQNLYKGPIVTGTYNGGTVSIPLTGLTLAASNGAFPFVPAYAVPDFGTFVIVVPVSSSKTC